MLGSAGMSVFGAKSASGMPAAIGRYRVVGRPGKGAMRIGYSGSDGGLKLLDFGIARLASSNMTASGMIMGTPDYMSPEQAQGKEVDTRSDIFSAAGVFYFMLTGRRPFEAAELPVVLQKVVREDP